MQEPSVFSFFFTQNAVTNSISLFWLVIWILAMTFVSCFCFPYLHLYAYNVIPTTETTILFPLLRCGENAPLSFRNINNHLEREQGWRSGESTCFPPMWPRYYVSRVCCWFSPCSVSFSLGTPVFFLPEKPSFPNSNSIRIQNTP